MFPAQKFFVDFQPGEGPVEGPAMPNPWSIRSLASTTPDKKALHALWRVITLRQRHECIKERAQGIMGHGKMPIMYQEVTLVSRI
jgi:hypothetical protein